MSIATDMNQLHHEVLGTSLLGPYPPGMAMLHVGMGCFWGAERLFWSQPGVHVTAVGYAGGMTPNPTYAQVCSGRTGHAEVVRVVYDPQRLALQHLLQLFWEHHDPTQGNRQGHDVGTQYRSIILWSHEAEREAVAASQMAYGQCLAERGYPSITTTIERLDAFYFAEPYHQQYLAKNPEGYCGLRGTGVACTW